MDISATLNQIKLLSIQDRIYIVQEILESITAEQDYSDLTEAQKQEIDHQIANFWLQISQISLNTIWDNQEDDIYSQLPKK